MKALSLHQPCASLIALGVKTIETRPWRTTYRGQLAIHASKQDPERRLRLGPAEVLDDGFGKPTICVSDRSPHLHADLPLGSVIATCMLRDVVPIVAFGRGEPEWSLPGGATWTPTSTVVALRDDEARVWNQDGNVWRSSLVDQSPARARAEAACGDYTPGRYAWLLEDVQQLEAPVAIRGRQGLWDWLPEDPF